SRGDLSALCAPDTLERHHGHGVDRVALMLGLSLALHHRVGGEASAPFPADDLEAWYDPSDLSTLWQDTEGTVPVTAAGQAVAKVTDKSGNGFDLAQSIPAARPIYKTDGTLHWLEFDGLDDNLRCPVGPRSAPGTFGMSLDVLSLPVSFANPAESASKAPQLYITQSQPNQLRGFWGDGFLFVSREAAFPDIGPTSLLTWLDGTVATLKSEDREFVTADVTPSGSDGPLDIGKASFHGRVFAATYHRSALTVAGRARVETYLNTRAGIA
ncbi:MAG: hypothetical protein AAF330_03150, partial [Pseudomonadota bacterium]